jgi:23S rRNA pseudouridine1911/1915/1917 synthase
MLNGQTLAAALKQFLEGYSWSQVRKLVAGRRVQVHGNLCVDSERRLREGDVVKVLEQATAAPVTAADVRLAHVDEHLVVVQKPAGVTTLRHREETDLPERRKQLQATLDELVQEALALHLGVRGPREPRTQPKRGKRSLDPRLKLRPVHRLDRDTSGLMVFARSPAAEQKLIRMFAQHAVQRAYVAVVQGRVDAQTIDTWLVRDRGDGLRGSLEAPTEEAIKEREARRAVTHVRPLEHMQDYTILECRLETGRTHQIRIHLSELGHPLCGERVYTHALGQPPRADGSGAPRQALHAAELALLHPANGKAMRFRMALPTDLKEWLLGLRRP